MYHASEQFHEAVYKSNPKERLLITMPELAFHAEDLCSTLTYTEPLNPDEELTIGSCPASTLEFKILNDHGLLSDYDFNAECAAYLGVCVEEKDGEGEMPYAILRYGTEIPVRFEGHLEKPYLTVNGQTPTIQPPFPVHSIVIDGNKVYCISETGAVWNAAWMDGRTWNAMAALTWGEAAEEKWADLFGYLVPLSVVYDWDALSAKTWDELNDGMTVWDTFIPELEIIPYMKAKFEKWALQKKGIWKNTDEVYEFGETIDRYEYVSLGKFIPEKPKKQRVVQIAFSATDRMMLFEKDATAFLDMVSYPTTIGAVLQGLCDYVGVILATPTFINSTRALSEALFDGEEVTCREILSWIAEAAGAYGKMTRDGEMAIVWYGTENVSIPMNQYFSIDVAEYEVKPVDKLQVMGSETDIGAIIGTGDNGYQIVDNPYLYGKNDTEIRTLAVPIYNRLNAFAAFRPIKARAVCDWSVEAGDVISIVDGETELKLPIYRQVITWNGGGARVTYESTGAERRKVMSATNRRVFNQKRAIHEIVVDVDGVRSRIENAESDITELELTAKGLALDISNNAGDIAALRITATELETEIQNTEQNLSSRITQTASELTTRIENAESGLRSEITQTVEGISLDVSNGSTSSILTLKSGSTTLSSKTIQFTGVVTFSDLSTRGSTTINGSNITTGTVSASRIDVDNLYVKHLSGADGTFTGTLSAVSGSFTNLSGTGQITLGRVTIDESGLTLLGGTNEVRFYMNPPTASGGAEARWVERDGFYSLGIYTSTRESKKHIRSIGNECSAIIDNLNPVYFRFRGEPNNSNLSVGFIADETDKACKEITAYAKDGTPIGVQYSSISALVVAELKSLRRRVAALEGGKIA